MAREAPTEAARRSVLERLGRALPRIASFASYAASVAIVLLALAIKAPLDALAGQPLPPYITFYPAVVICALVGGPRVGVGVGVATLLIAIFFLLPGYFTSAPRSAMNVTIAIYAVTSTLTGLIVGYSRLAFDRVAASELERHNAVRESVHRIKNLVAVTQAIASKVARETQSVEQFEALLRERLSAVGHAQDVLIRRDWQDVGLDEMIRSALEPFLYNPGLQVKAGPNVMVPAHHVGGLCMALYELCTNAMKYGALASSKGPVLLTWDVREGVATLSWLEKLPAPVSQERSGFGSALIRNALARASGTSVRYEIAAQRVEAEFSWPAAPSS